MRLTTPPQFVFVLFPTTEFLMLITSRPPLTWMADEFEVFEAIVTKLRWSSPSMVRMAPPNTLALFPEIVLLVMVRVPLFAMPPPRSALFSEIVLPVMTIVEPGSTRIPPPLKPELFLEIVLLVMSTVPRFLF